VVSIKLVPKTQQDFALLKINAIALLLGKMKRKQIFSATTNAVAKMIVVQLKE